MDPSQDSYWHDAVERILAHCGPRVVCATPLGLGKPNRLLNALYQRVAQSPAHSLQLFTALSLARPVPGSDLERRFLQPFLDRHFGADYPDLAFVRDLRAGKLPANVAVQEFYLQSGAWLSVPQAQQQYASLNYTHVAREVARRGVNVVLQLVARRAGRLSFSCNPDLTPDLMDKVAAAGKPRPLTIAVVHPALPFLGGTAEVPDGFFDLVLDEPAPAHRLFALPASPVADAEFALGLHASTLVRDGGTLQIGIGALSDALVHALLLRHRDNDSYRQVLAAVEPQGVADIVGEVGGTDVFAHGLYGASEMVMDGFMHLRRGGVLVRRVYDHLGLQRLIDAGEVRETLDAAGVEALVARGIIPSFPDPATLDALAALGIMPEGTVLETPLLVLRDGTRIPADFRDAGHRARLAQALSGRSLRGGRYLDGGFYLGTRQLYDWLAQLEGEDYTGLGMTRISHINELYGGQEMQEKVQRRQARFFNTCMMQTLLGAAVSDALEDGRVVSGVGGQYNFVAMAHALEDGRSVLLLRASRESDGELRSNIVWNYGHTTIPRHLRDLVVTEYGIADLRGASDEECIERLLAISDARFVEPLAEQAKAAGKLRRGYIVPDHARGNTAAAIAAALKPYKARGLFPRFPFGSDFDADELTLAAALQRLKAATRSWQGKLATVARAWFGAAPDANEQRLLARLALATPANRGERLSAKLVLQALRAGVRT